MYISNLMDQKPGHLKLNLSDSIQLSQDPGEVILLLHSTISQVWNEWGWHPLSSPLRYLSGISKHAQNWTSDSCHLSQSSLSLFLWAHENSILPIALAKNFGVSQDSGFWTYVTFTVRLSTIILCKIILPLHAASLPSLTCSLVLHIYESAVSLLQYIIISEG